MALPTCENTLFAFEPMSRIVPTTITRITANITAYSAMSCPLSSFQSCFNRFATGLLFLVCSRLLMTVPQTPKGIADHTYPTHSFLRLICNGIVVFKLFPANGTEVPLHTKVRLSGR